MALTLACTARVWSAAARTAGFRMPFIRALHSSSVPSAAAAAAAAAASPQTKEDVGALDELVRDFVEPADFYNACDERGIRFFAGVPDSLLKDFCAYVSDHAPEESHVITSNEGSAVALAAGHHLATGKIPLVYFQNSGLGNAVNPLLSLADSQVYGIPMLLLIGWRGEPGKKDEVQHRVQGAVTPAMLSSMNIPFETLPDYIEGAEEVLDSAVNRMRGRSSPFALLVKKQTFAKYKMSSKPENNYPLTREDFLRIALTNLGRWDAVVSTTGFASREVFELRVELGHDHCRDFLTVGSMGHATALAGGICLGKKSRQVFCLDGDGAAIMHLGTMATVGTRGLTNFKHVIINNGVHDSVGAQPTQGFGVDFCGVALAAGYKHAIRAETEEEIIAGLNQLREMTGPALLEVRVRDGARANLGRPTTNPKQNKQGFMDFLQA